MTIIIRAGLPADDARCGEIVGAAAAASAYAARLPHARRALADTSPLPAEGRRRLIAQRADRVVGFADHRDDGHIKLLFVEPAAQGRGAGAALLDAVARRTGRLSVHCLAVNDAALAWYLGRGFRVAGGWLESFHGRDAVWLRLERDALPTGGARG
jgi:GNAT superfamily N-acetyltransferase